MAGGVDAARGESGADTANPDGFVEQPVVEREVRRHSHTVLHGTMCRRRSVRTRHADLVTRAVDHATLAVDPPGRLPVCESPKEPCMYCDPPAPQARPGDAAPKRPHRRAVGRLAHRAIPRAQRQPCRAQPHRRAGGRLAHQAILRVRRQAWRARPRQALRKPHLACHLARSTDTVSSGSDVAAPATRTRHALAVGI